jgi:glycosyltransferase involved in cell wall biosynthesis
VNILMVASRFPLPRRSGDTNVCFNRIRGLAGDHRITLACLVENPPSPDDLAVMSQYCDVHWVRKPAAKRLADTAWRGLFKGEPLQLAYFHSGPLRARIAQLHRQVSFDIAHVFLLRALPLVEDLPIPRLLDVNDSQTLAVGHRAERARGLKALALRVEARRMAALEQRLGGAREKIVVLSDTDQKYFRPGAADIIPMGVDLPAKGPGQSPEPLAVFSGNMGYYPNVEAALAFINQAWPEVRRAQPTARLKVVGREPPASLLELNGKDGIEVTGEVPDMAAAIAPAWVALAPMSVAWGMHTKVLEAMAAALPVVATPAAGKVFHGAEGHGLFLHEMGTGFADQVAALLTDRAQAEGLGRAARDYIARTYSWDAANSRINGLYHNLVGGA